MKSKLSSILLSIGLALALWLYVITVVSPGSRATFYNVPVVLEGASVLEERGLIVTDVDTTSVTLELSGNRVDLNELNSGNITIKANLATVYEAGEAIQLAYTISYPGTVANNAFTEESRSPGYITVTVEEKDSKDILVNVVYSGSVPTGYISKTDEETLDYQQIHISGPASVVERITQARVDVDLTGQTESINQTYRYTLCDANGEPVDSELITVNATEVRLQVPVQQIKTVNLALNIVDGGGVTAQTVTIGIDPGSIRICGSKAALEDLGDELIIGTVYLADYSGEVELTFDIVLPEGITNLSAQTEATVTMVFPELSERSININNIRAVNVPEGLEVEILTQVLTVRLRGPAGEIVNISADDIQVTVDFSNAEPGTTFHKVSITISGEYPGVGVLGSYNVSAIVESAGNQEG